MNYENDIFDYLGIVGREDSYTNLLKVLFENLPEYKKEFLKILFDENNLNADDFYFETRKSILIKVKTVRHAMKFQILLLLINKEIILR